MKTRQSLVSNSSSTSFIIAYKPSNKCPTCGHSQGDLLDKIKCREDYDHKVYAVGIQNVKKELEDWATFEEDERILLLNRLDSFSKEFEVIYCSISNHDDKLWKEIDRVEETGGKILFRIDS